MVEEGILLEFGDKHVTLHKDGTIELLWQSREYPVIAVPALEGVLEDVLAAQQRLPRPVLESRVFVRFGAFEVQIAEGWRAPLGRRAKGPWEFDWDAETLTGFQGSQAFRDEFVRRMWRAAGKNAFDPE